MRILVCGSRMRNIEQHREYIYAALLEEISMDDTVIEGCCPNSADVIAEEVARKKWAKLDHNPAKDFQHLKRNLMMLDKCDKVVAVWDGYSYGTAFVIANAVMRGLPVKVYPVNADRR
jgi:hypothetical protein